MSNQRLLSISRIKRPSLGMYWSTLVKQTSVFVCARDNAGTFLGVVSRCCHTHLARFLTPVCYTKALRTFHKDCCIYSCSSAVRMWWKSTAPNLPAKLNGPYIGIHEGCKKACVFVWWVSLVFVLTFLRCLVAFGGDLRLDRELFNTEDGCCLIVLNWNTCPRGFFNVCYCCSIYGCVFVFSMF